MRLVLPLCALGLLLVGAADSLLAQETRRVNFADHGFSLAVPAEWQQIPDSAVAEFERVEDVPPHLDVQTIAAFQPFPHPRHFTPPYVLVKLQGLGDMSAAQLAAMARNPVRLAAIQDWLDHIADSYGTRYGLENFAWDDRDGIFWIVASGVEEPFPEIVSVSGAIPSPGGAILIAYRAFPHTDLRLVRDTVRSILLSARVAR